MKKITFPDELNLKDLQAIQIFEYQSAKDIIKQQIILNQNTFSFLMEGNKEVVFDSSALSIDNSQFLIMKSGHCLMTEKLSNHKVYISVLLFFPNDHLLKFIQKNEINIKQPVDFNSVFSFSKDEFIQGYVKSLLDISKFSKAIQNKILLVKFEEIMIYLTSKYGTDFLGALIEKNNKSSQRLIQIVEANWMSKLTLKDLAFLCNMSVSTFKREFTKIYAESPIKWSLNKRLEHAHYLINHKNKISSEIYAEVGFESLSSFIQAYKSKYGMTPKQHFKN